MIRSFKHKGLRRFHERGEDQRLNQHHIDRVRLILTTLDAATTIERMGFPGSGLHRLRGTLSAFWSVKVSGNWRIIFRFEDGDAFDVDYLDYH